MLVPFLACYVKIARSVRSCCFDCPGDINQVIGVNTRCFAWTCNTPRRSNGKTLTVGKSIALVALSRMDLLSATDEAVQASERMLLLMKKQRDKYSTEVFQKCVESLDNLRSIKSSIENRGGTIKSPDVTDNCLQDLRQLTLMHTPASITENVRTKYQDIIQKMFGEQAVEVLYAVLMTCPWYSCTQKERGEQAKHNMIYVVYKSPLPQFFSPVNNHAMEQANVVDKDWFMAYELFHFVQFLAKGRTRTVEALYCPDTAVLYQTEAFMSLRQTLNPTTVMGLRGFIEACRGQSVGGIGKKGKDGKFRMKDSTTFRELCDSFRLMHNAHNTTIGVPPCTEELELSNLPEVAKLSVEKLQSMYQNPDVSKRDVFDLLVEWQEEVYGKLKSIEFTNPDEVQRIVGDWHMAIRLEGKTVQPLAYPEDEHSKLVLLMEEIGGPVGSLQPEQILMITQAGSYMYGLSTPTSDTDYVVIYAEKSEKILSSCKRLPEIVENRGPSKQIEYGAYEARCFAEMLMKGSVVILELVFKDDHNYMSPSWRKLADNRHRFLTERGIQQYLGLIKNNFKMIESNKHKDGPQERKLFYQIFHKLDSLEYFLQGSPPPVKCSGPVRDFILRVRTAPLQGDLERQVLYNYAMQKYLKLQTDLANRRMRLAENGDFNFLVQWLMSVRGLGELS